MLDTLRAWLCKQRAMANPPYEPGDRNFYFIFQSADGTMKVRYGIRRSDLAKVVAQLEICLKAPRISSILLIVALRPFLGEDDV